LHSSFFSEKIIQEFASGKKSGRSLFNIPVNSGITAYRRIQRFKPETFPPLHSIIVLAESAISGTSTDPAKTFGPALISGQWNGCCI